MNCKTSLISLVVIMALLISVSGVLAQESGPQLSAALGTAFTYQGQLKNASGPVTGNCDFQFGLWDAVTNGAQIASDLTRTNVGVINGLFTTPIDFGVNAFEGNARWLEIAVRCPAGSGSFTTLTPRQPLTPAPYALYAPTSGNTTALQGRGITTTAPTSGQVLKWNGVQWSPADDAIGSPGSGDISAVNAGYGLSGGGTSGEVTLAVVTSTIQVRVNGACPIGSAIRTINQDGTVLCETDDNSIYTAGAGLVLSGTQFSLLAPYRLPQACSSNQVAKWNGSVWICANDDVGNGGNFWSLTGNAGTTPSIDFLGTTDNVALTLAVSGTAVLRLQPNTSSPNIIGGHWTNGVTPGTVGATIGGGGALGSPNTVQNDYGMIGGGYSNVAGQLGFVGGGAWNSANGVESTVGGGVDNRATGPVTVIGGGETNRVSGYAGTVAGGSSITVTGNYAVVGGGHYNLAEGGYTTIGGGSDNFVTGGWYGTVSGGGNNKALNGSATVAGGYQNTAGGQNAVVSGGYNNSATMTNTTVSGGESNFASGELSTIGGGERISVTGRAGTVGGGSWITATGNYATVGGGNHNMINGHAATVGGGVNNTIFINGYAATIGGGYGNVVYGNLSTVGGGQTNTANGSASTVAGGWNNAASGDNAVVGGGNENQASGYSAVIGGGQQNTASAATAMVGGGYKNIASGENSTIGGGDHISVTGKTGTVSGGSWITVTGSYATVGGGLNNRATQTYATVSGGSRNTASGMDAIVGGGWGNTASEMDSTVSGGEGNSATGLGATVPGGYSNQAQGWGSLAAGTHAIAAHPGTFVWADSSSHTDYTSQRDNQFKVRATGGVLMDINSGGWINFYSGTNLIDTSTGAYLSIGGTWTNSSDRNLKENFTPVDGRAVLAKVTQLPLSQWNYKAENGAVQHLGPMAQDWYAAFGLGSDSTHISTVDADGVALAAIQGLYAEVKDRDTRIVTLEKQNAELRARLEQVEQRLGSTGRADSVTPIGWWLFAVALLIAGGLSVRHCGQA